MESAISYFWTELTNPRYFGFPTHFVIIQFIFSLVALLFLCPTHVYLSSAAHQPPFQLANPTGPEALAAQRQDASSVLPSCAQPPSNWNVGYNNSDHRFSSNNNNNWKLRDRKSHSTLNQFEFSLSHKFYCTCFDQDLQPFWPASRVAHLVTVE